MLSQHIITKPVFDALFEGYSFTAHNPVSKAMQGVLEQLQGQNLEKEQEELQDFYDRVKRQIGDIKTATKVAEEMPPTVPATVLDGESFGMILRLPMDLPHTYCNTSLDCTTTIMKISSKTLFS